MKKTCSTNSFKEVPATEIKKDLSFVPNTVTGNKSPTANGTGYIFYTASHLGEKFLSKECAPGRNVMEIGAGYGNIPVRALKNGVSSYLVNEMEKAHIDLLLQKVEKEAGQEALKKLSIIHGRVPESLPEANERFDAIMIDKVIHFMSPDEVHYFLDWSKKAIVKGGALYLSVATPFVKFYKKMIPLYLDNLAKGKEFPGHFTNTMELIAPEEMREYLEFLVPNEMIFFSKKDIVNILEKHNFKIVYSKTVFSPNGSSDSWQEAPDNEGNIVEVICIRA